MFLGKWLFFQVTYQALGGYGQHVSIIFGRSWLRIPSKRISTIVIYCSRLAVLKYMYEGRLQSSWTNLITPSRNFVKVWWRSFFRNTFLGKRCTSYNASPTSRKRAADRWSLRNFLPRSPIFMVGKAQKSHGARSGQYGGCSDGVPPISVSAFIATLAVCGQRLSWRLLRHPKKGSFKTTVTPTLTTVRGMKSTPLLRYPHHYNLA
jgi:hypothetical protein